MRSLDAPQNEIGLGLPDLLQISLRKKDRRALEDLFQGCTFQIKDGKFEIEIPEDFYHSEEFKEGACELAKWDLNHIRRQRRRGHKRKHDVLIQRSRKQYRDLSFSKAENEALFWQVCGLIEEGADVNEAMRMASDMLGMTISEDIRVRIFSRIFQMQVEIGRQRTFKEKAQNQIDQLIAFQDEPTEAEIRSEAKIILREKKTDIEDKVNRAIKVLTERRNRDWREAMDRQRGEQILKSKGGLQAIRQQSDRARTAIAELMEDCCDFPPATLNRLARRIA